MALLSVVLPAYNEEQVISEAVERISCVLQDHGIEYELVFVDDGSSDRTWEILKEKGKSDLHLTGVHFSRNFGKEAAVMAGLRTACGDAVAVMDCDLQHPPEILPLMYQKWLEGYEVIEGIKSSRGKESLLHKAFAGFFYGLMTGAAKFDMKNTSDFKLLDRKAVNSILDMPESSLFFRAASAWVGYRSTQVSFEVQERKAGESKWSTRGLIRYAMTNIISFTTAPLQFITFLGALGLLFSFVLLIYSLIQYFCGNVVEGYTTLLIVILFTGSSIMVSLGIIGYYIGKIYEEVKHRPRYIISEIINKKIKQQEEQ